MRISDVLALGALLLAGSPALAMDAGGRAPGATASAVPSPVATATPLQAFRAGTQFLRNGENEKALDELRFAAEQGHLAAQWKLARMYANGEGVDRDDLKAYQYFSRIASDHAEISPWTTDARFVANAYVALAGYYLAGIPNSPVQAEAGRARNLLNFAASYFSDADAQYHLARLYLDGLGGAKDVRQGIRWLGLSAQKGQYKAQALLGHMMFRGEGVPRQRSRGLMWLTLARDAAAGAEDGWIVKAYDEAFARANEVERTAAFADLEQWLKSHR